MGMKFLNKKGWHTGSLRNIENVWKAEQKEAEETRKLEELRKNIREERERDEFRQLQEQAGFAPRQERLEFLYDSGLSVGKSSNEGFSALQNYPPPPPAAPTSSAASALAAPASTDSFNPGALFEEKPQSANDSWRKLHSDPLLMIRQREQEALARIKNNPVKMAMIRKSVETKKKDDEAHEKKQKKLKSKHKRHSSKHQPESENDSAEGKARERKSSHKANKHLDSDEDTRDKERHHGHSHKDHSSDKRRRDSPVKQKPDETKGRERLHFNEESRDDKKHHRHSHGDHRGEKSHGRFVDRKTDDYGDREQNRRGYENIRHETYRSDHLDGKSAKKTLDDARSSHRAESPKHDSLSRQGKAPQLTEEKERAAHLREMQMDDRSARKALDIASTSHTAVSPKRDSHRRRAKAPQLTEEERAARLKEMQMDAELHEEQRFKRLKKAEEDDAREASKATVSRGSSFLDAVQKSVYGAEAGGSSTIEESVRRRSHFHQGKADVERNAFRR